MISLQKIIAMQDIHKRNKNNMTKKYQKPVIKIHKISNDYQILAGSDKVTQINTNRPTDLGEIAPGNAGRSTGAQDVGAKSNTFGVWDDYE